MKRELANRTMGQQNQVNRDKKMRCTYQKERDIYDKMQRSNVHLIFVPEGGERENGAWQ